MAPARRRQRRIGTTPVSRHCLPTSPITPHSSSVTLLPQCPSSPRLTQPTQLALLTLQARSPFRLPEQQILSTKRSPLSEEKRAAAVSILLQLSREFAKQAAVPALAIYYFDAFLAHCTPRSVRGVHAPLVAAACFLVAIKMLDPVVPTTSDIAARLKGRIYSPELILNCELLVCVSLNFDFCLRVPHNVIPHLCKLATAVESAYTTGGKSQATRIASPFNHDPRSNVTRRMDLELDAHSRTRKAHEPDDANYSRSSSSNAQSRIMDKSTSLSRKRALREDGGKSCIETAMAFADLALYCSRLLPEFGVGEISAACTLIASLGAGTEDDTSFDVGDYWLPLFDLAELNCFRVFAVVASICEKLGDLLLVRSLAAQYEHRDLNNISKLLRADVEFAEQARKHRDTVLEIFDGLAAQLDPCDIALRPLYDEDKVESLLELVHMKMTSEDDATTWLTIHPAYSNKFHITIQKRLQLIISKFPSPGCYRGTRGHGQSRPVALQRVLAPRTNVIVAAETSQPRMACTRFVSYKHSAIVKKARIFNRDRDGAVPTARMLTRSQARARAANLPPCTLERRNGKAPYKKSRHELAHLSLSIR